MVFDTFPSTGECHPNLVTFSAVRGKFVTGSVEPVLAGVAVTAKSVKEDRTLEGVTDKNGQFS